MITFSSESHPIEEHTNKRLHRSAADKICCGVCGGVAEYLGDVGASGLQLTGQSTRPHTLSGNLANGGPTVSVRTTSGSIRLLHGL